jgi:outer membrane receptor protein involved in Fe transport
LPITLRHFFPQRFFGDVRATHVRQRVEQTAASAASGTDLFVLLDVGIGYRLPKRSGSVNLAINNLLDQRFSYQDDNFRSSETRLPRYLPRRTAVLTASLAF